jgi:hypothetical protein
MTDKQLELWDLWYPFAAATGVSFARGRLDPTDVLWIHSAPDALTVEIRSDDGRLLARGQDLMRTTKEGLPMTRLKRIADRVVREDMWPNQDAVGKAVILPGGEVGIIKSWWHAPDHSEWRWLVEFYNHR